MFATAYSRAWVGLESSDSVERSASRQASTVACKANALIEPFKSVSVLGKWTKNRLSVEVLVT